jgi:transcriptional regulator with XRE-family HTH domain
MKFLSKNLNFLRKRRGLNQDEMLDARGYKRSTWSTWELGNSEPALDDLIIIADFFGVSLDELVREDLTEKIEKGNLTPFSVDTEKGNLKGNGKGNLSGKKEENTGLGSKDSNCDEALRTKDEMIMLQKDTIDSLKLAHQLLLKNKKDLENEVEHLKKRITKDGERK